MWKLQKRERPDWARSFAWLPTTLNDGETVVWFEAIERKLAWQILDGSEYEYRLPIAGRRALEDAALREGEQG